MAVTTEMVIGVVGALSLIIGVFVGVSTLTSRRDAKTSAYAKTEQSLTTISQGVSDLRVDVKSGFRDIDSRLTQVESRICGLEGKTEIQQQAINRAHSRIDDMHANR